MTNDQLLAALCDTFRRTDNQEKVRFLRFFDMDIEESRLFLRDIPPEWICFIKRAALAGLKECLLQAESAESIRIERFFDEEEAED